MSKKHVKSAEDASASNSTNAAASYGKELHQVFGEIPRSGCDFAAPLFVLASPRSFSSVTCAMLGQHPQMYGLPETHLFTVRTVSEWWTHCSRSEWPMRHGLLRAIAQIFFGEQTETTVKQAAGWILRREHLCTGYLFEVLAEELRPLILVEKSPGIVRRIEFMRRAYKMFPQARFMHLVRHPRAQGNSLMKFLECNEARGPRRPPKALSGSERYHGAAKRRNWPRVVDLQRAWYAQNMNICNFLESVPEDKKLRVRGEDLLGDPEGELRRIISWLGLTDDADTIEKMKHPEQSPFARFGPRGARFGNDPSFLKNPVLRTIQSESKTLDGPLEWRDDGGCFLPKVRKLAEAFGYD